MTNTYNCGGLPNKLLLKIYYRHTRCTERKVKCIVQNLSYIYIYYSKALSRLIKFLHLFTKCLFRLCVVRLTFRVYRRVLKLYLRKKIFIFNEFNFNIWTVQLEVWEKKNFMLCMLNDSVTETSTETQAYYRRYLYG